MYGISQDSVTEQARFAEEHQLGSPLLSDPDGSGTAKYEVPLIGDRYASRMTFVIDPAGVLRHIDRVVRVDTHGGDLLALIERLREYRTTRQPRASSSLRSTPGRSTPGRRTIDAHPARSHNEAMQVIVFENGDRMPALGLGTWKSEPGEIGATVREAVRLGYRHFDCATIYGNQAEVGEALADCMAQGWVRREELWITSKLWNDCHRERDVRPALEATLADLRLEYLDLYLIHWPVAQRKGVLGPESAADFLSLDEVPLAETWRGLEAAREAGLCRHVGVSNFSVAKLEDLAEHARVTPELNQVELHPYLQQEDLLAWCRDRGVAVTAYSPLGSPDRSAELRASDEPDLLADPRLAAIAARRGVTPAQVLLAWALARGTAVIPKSVHPERLAQNLAATEVTLAPEDLQDLATLELGRRYLTGAFWVLEGGPYTLANLWDQGSGG